MSNNSKEKLSKFAIILSQLRKERGISQKKAATDLGISQALLSHYEKGIRECGLDFVIKCSEYYGVTTDYLLGVSDSRTGIATDSLSQLDDDEEHSVSTLAKATKYLLDISAASSTESQAFSEKEGSFCKARKSSSGAIKIISFCENSAKILTALLFGAVK